MTQKLCQNATFEKGGYPIQIDILHVLLNILSISLLSRIHGTVGLLRDAKRVIISFYVLKKINKMQMAG